MRELKTRKITEQTIVEFNWWLDQDYVHKVWPHEDYEDVTVYENLDGDIICIRRDESGEILEAWME